MPSNSEMYDRGVFDAEHDELNLFYYQHYYYYRRGYDDGRRQLRRGPGPARALPLLLFGALAMLALAAGFWLFAPRDGTGEQPTAQPAALATRAPLATATRAPTAAPTAAPTSAPAPALAVGGRARVANLNGSPLRAREAPGLSQPVVARIPEGGEVTLREGPAEADGYRWWRVETADAAGWVAEGSPEGVAFLEPIP
jgi:hypothetical protein